MVYKIKWLCLCVIFGFSLLYAQDPPSRITADAIRNDVRYLASDELEGRASGTSGNEKAAAYVMTAMKEAGLKPAGDAGTYYQKFDFVAALKLGQGNQLLFASGKAAANRVSLAPDMDFRPFGFSADTTVTGPLVFAGYGISAPENSYDDYASVDVTGKVVVVLRYSPDGTDPHGQLNRFSALRNKARAARDRGAAALIIVTGPSDDKDDELVKLAYDQAFAGSGIPAVSMKRAAVEPLLKAAGHSIKGLQDSINSSRKPVSFVIPGVTATLRTDVEKVTGYTANVAGFLEGHDPALKDQVIVIGAHFDHLGYGGAGSGSLLPDTVAIHHGADDNASGTAGLLALVRAYGAHAQELKRTILFLSFSGEELGTLGSAYYVNHPFFPNERAVVMVNMDMIGRLDSHHSLTVYGTGSSPVWPGILGKEDADSSLALREIADGFGPSDQAQFYGKDLPVLFFFTGVHDDYHKPSDTWEKINYAGEEQVVRYVYRVVNDIESAPERPQFTKAPSSAPMGGDGSRSFSVTLGIIPDYAGAEGGMKIGSIRANGPAEKAGLKAGDLLVKMAGKKVMNIYDYMGVLGELKPGDVVEVVVMRDGKPVTATATMTKRN